MLNISGLGRVNHKVKGLNQEVEHYSACLKRFYLFV